MPKTIILITGANSGIGYATVKVLADASPDYHIIMTGRNKEPLEAAKTEIEITSIKGTLSTITLDVTKEETVTAAADEVSKQFGKLDVLVNNAGLSDSTLPKEWSLKQKLDQILTTNVTGPAIVSEAFKPLLLKGTNARSIYVSSGLGSLTLCADPDNARYHSKWTVYRTSKTALNMWALQDFKEMAPLGIKVFTFCPGLVRSNLRGKAEEMVSAGGNATDPSVSGVNILKIIRGERDDHVGKFIHKDGVYDW
jgi:NAD(P)-dependent dehydrogenase (short-subunit alcohol dehydrogenase family)